jgi:hypothetical protein
VSTENGLEKSKSKECRLIEQVSTQFALFLVHAEGRKRSH